MQVLDSLIRVRMQQVRKNLDYLYEIDSDIMLPEISFLEGKIQGLEEVLDILESNNYEEKKHDSARY